MKKIIIILTLLLLVLSVSACGKKISTDTVDTGSKNLNTESPITNQDVSELILQVTDLPEGYKIADQRPRVKSDLSNTAINYDWESGYYIKFIKLGDNALIENSVIEQHISKYPLEKIKDMFNEPKETVEGGSYEDLPGLDIGDLSNAYILTITKDGQTEKAYFIEFIKKNIYQSFLMSGTITNYELLKELAIKAEKIIK